MPKWGPGVIEIGNDPDDPRPLLLLPFSSFAAPHEVEQHWKRSK